MTAVRSLLNSQTPAVWLFVGDSITQGALHTFGSRDFTQIFAERIRFELGRGRDLVVNGAVSSATSGDALGNLDEALCRLKPQATFVMLGINDASADRPDTAASLKANLLEIFRKLAECGSAAIFQTSPPLLPAATSYRGKHPGMMQAVREAAKETGAPLVDHETYWQDYAAARPARNLEYLMSDPVHPNAYGHVLMAQLLLTELDIFDPASPACRAFVP